MSVSDTHRSPWWVSALCSSTHPIISVESSFASIARSLLFTHSGLALKFLQGVLTDSIGLVFVAVSFKNVKIFQAGGGVENQHLVIRFDPSILNQTA